MWNRFQNKSFYINVSRINTSFGCFSINGRTKKEWYLPKIAQ